MSTTLETERLRVQPWEPVDAPEAFALYTEPSLSRWLTPAVRDIPDVAAMRARIRTWQRDTLSSAAPTGHWAVRTRALGDVVGGLSLSYAPPGGESLVVAWLLAPAAWGRGYAAEAGSALVRWAVHEAGAPEVFAIVPPDNLRAAATARRMGMEWVTELRHLAPPRYEVYRLRHGDLGLAD